ncbi:MAG: DUF45 domain-containing protein [Chloroflexi bacterium]|nr:DUF45 domain-containing protein [Chloroflexota bacterium]MDA1218207.1 DUF45 domain-containing protein [Chloroflexota bacterium]
MNSAIHHDYTIKLRNNSKSIRLQVSLANGLEVCVPRGVSSKQIEKVLNQNQEWIVGSLGQIQKRLGQLAPQAIELRAIEKRWEVEYETTANQRISVEESGYSTLLVKGNLGNSYGIALALRRWLGGKAQEHLLPWLNGLSEEFDLSFDKVVIRGQTTRWGSCSSLKTISINRNLLFLPLPLVRYVLIHELVHTIQLDHSRRFWELLGERVNNSRNLDRAAKRAWHYAPPWAYEK